MAYLYEIRISDGTNNPNWQTFFLNMQELNAKASGFEGLRSVCVVGHDLDADAVHAIATDGFHSGFSDVTVTEITGKTLKANHPHAVYNDLVKNYFLPHGQYPNIAGRK